LVWEIREAVNHPPSWKNPEGEESNLYTNEGQWMTLLILSLLLGSTAATLGEDLPCRQQPDGSYHCDCVDDYNADYKPECDPDELHTNYDSCIDMQGFTTCDDPKMIALCPVIGELKTGCMKSCGLCGTDDGDGDGDGDGAAYNYGDVNADETGFMGDLDSESTVDTTDASDDGSASYMANQAQYLGNVLDDAGDGEVGADSDGEDTLLNAEEVDSITDMAESMQHVDSYDETFTSESDPKEAAEAIAGTIHGVNNPLHDVADADADGEITPEEAGQMAAAEVTKAGGTPDEAGWCRTHFTHFILHTPPLRILRCLQFNLRHSTKNRPKTQSNSRWVQLVVVVLIDYTRLQLLSKSERAHYLSSNPQPKPRRKLYPILRTHKT
jgi:hypothetical protein